MRRLHCRGVGDLILQSGPFGLEGREPRHERRVVHLHQSGLYHADQPVDRALILREVGLKLPKLGAMRLRGRLGLLEIT